jgi:hypothetical protein
MRIHLTHGIAALATLLVAGAFVAATASARPPSTYRNWAQTSHNSAGVVFRPYGDTWEVWYNRRDQELSAVLVQFNYKGIKDGWHTVLRQIVIGPTHWKFRRNVAEHHRIFFRIVEGAKVSPISEYRTT